MNKVKKIITLFILLLSLVSWAQIDTTFDKYYVPTGKKVLINTDASKVSDIPATIETAVPVPKMSYPLLPKKINTNFNVEPIKAAQAVGEPLEKLYKGLVKGGIGTYTTPYAEVFYNNLRSKEFNYGVHYRHLSSSATLKGYGYSGFSQNTLNLYGKRFVLNNTFYGALDYDRNVVHYYGYDINKFDLSNSQTKQYYNYFAGNVGLMSHLKDSTKINHHTKINYFNLSDLSVLTENYVKAESELSRYMEKELLRCDVSLQYHNRRTTPDSISNTVFRVNPAIVSKGKKWKADIGMDVTIDKFSDTSAKFYFYPSITAHYNVIDNIMIPYAGITGGLDKNTHRSLSTINPFVNAGFRILNTSRAIETYFGLRGTLSTTTSYDVRATYNKINNAPFFVLDTLDMYQNKFMVVYDNVKLVTLHGEIQYQKSEKLRFVAKGNYLSYTMDKEQQPWHTPSFNGSLSANYNLSNKIVTRLDVVLYGKQYAPGPNKTIKTINSFVDINLGAEYRYTKRLSAFLHLNNLTGGRYFRWDNYPTQRFNLLGGFAYSF